MIIASSNIRGLGGVGKRNYLKELIRKECLEFLAIQETKLETIPDSLCNSLWGGDDCCWVSLPSSGNSGGILSIWSKALGVLKFSFTGEGFVGVCLEWGPLKKVCFVVNIYSKCDLISKRRLWETLLGIKRQVGRGAWCLIGDFNAVLHSEERKGQILLNPNYMRAEVAEFSDFVRSSDLMDLPILGRKFTWFHPNGSTMSRIDRMLVNDDWLLLWNNPTLWVLPRSVSDHCSLIVRYSGFDWGPKPFRFNNHWLLNNNFHGVVEDYWRNCNFTGWMAVILKEKLKGLKSILRVWNKENYGQMDSKMNNLIEDIKRLDLKSESLGISEEEVLLHKRKFSEMWQHRRCKESTIRQQSRQTWLREGDSNSRFFHASVKSRGKRNLISALQVGETWLESPADIRQATVDYFKLKFSTVSCLRPKLDGVSFPSLSEEENCWLTRPFALEELESMVKECDGNKSPGPDGFNFAFVKALWNVFKGEIRIMFDQFHGIGSLPKSFTSYFVALIPKINSPFSLGDFRPISLLGCLYKMIAKVWTARLV
jgi:hypothetical protein